jgi:TIR domain
VTCWFFMSYARADDQENEGALVRDFFDDLKAEVARRITDQSPPIAFFDQANLSPGDTWPKEIAEALCSCLTFVAVLTARYFTREYCGREWTIFESRCTDYSPTPPPLIIPIPWVRPVEGKFPDFATDIMMTFDTKLVASEERRNFQDYSNYGLLQIAKRKESTHKNTYNTILELLAAKIILAAQTHRLSTLTGTALPSLKDAANRFAVFQAASPGPAAAAARANFAIVTAKLAVMSSLRENAQDYYGPGSEFGMDAVCTDGA